MARVTRLPGPNRSKADGISGHVIAGREVRRGIVYCLHVHDPVSGTAFVIELTATERRTIIARWKEADAQAPIRAAGTRSRGGMPSRPLG